MSRNRTESTLASKLSDKGIRLTRQRRTIIDLMEQASDHLHASDLLRLAQERDARIDRATVYRTLAMLKQHGLVEELDLLHLDGSEHHYELKLRSGHVHIGCTGCGKIVEFETELVAGLETEIARKTGWEVNSVRVEVSAHCPECVSKR